MVDRMKMSWMGVVITLALMVACCVLYALGHEQAAGVFVAMLAGQVMPQPVKMHEGE
jgi:hypothetical protein